MDIFFFGQVFCESQVNCVRECLRFKRCLINVFMTVKRLGLSSDEAKEVICQSITVKVIPCVSVPTKFLITENNLPFPHFFEIPSNKCR